MDLAVAIPDVSPPAPQARRTLELRWRFEPDRPGATRRVVAAWTPAPASSTRPPRILRMRPPDRFDPPGASGHTAPPLLRAAP